MEKFFKFLSGTFAAIPGATILISALGVPDPNDKILFGGIIEAIGCGILGFIYMNNIYFLGQSLQKISSWVVASFIVFFVSIVVYIILFKVCVKQYEDFSPVYFPLFPNQLLSDEITSAGGKFEFVRKWFGDGANARILKLASTQLIITNIIFLCMYQFVFTSLTIGFGFLSIRQEKFNNFSM